MDHVVPWHVGYFNMSDPSCTVLQCNCMCPSVHACLERVQFLNYYRYCEYKEEEFLANSEGSRSTPFSTILLNIIVECMEE